MDTMNVKLVPGKRVRIPEAGNAIMGSREYSVPINQFWLKRIQDGDVVIVAPKPEPKAEKKGGDK